MKQRFRNILRIFAVAVGHLLWVGPAAAQTPIPVSTQFDVTGFIQEATLDTTCTLGAHCGGMIKVNGLSIKVPNETIVILPANALTWQELFAKAPAPWGIPGISGVTSTLPTTGLAMADCANPTLSAAGTCQAPPLTTYEAQVIGNRVLGATDQYIAGLIYISQHSLSIGAGFISFIDYTLGEMRIGGIPGDANCVQGGTVVSNPLCSGARVQINDPSGRYGRSTTSPDVRFTVDADNPTIQAGTGFPMCFPRVDPTSATPDALCPQLNRPAAVAPATGFAAAIFMPDPALFPGVFPDAKSQAPFEVGDYVMFSGTLVKDPPMSVGVPTGVFATGDGPTVGPLPAVGTAGTYVSAHTIVNNVAIYTAPGASPAYVMTDTALIGTGGLSVLGAGEAAIRTRFEGMMTDPTRMVHLYAMDLDPATGAVTDRDLGTIGADPGPAAGGAVAGRWRFRPPCAAFGTVPTKLDKQCVYSASGTFLPPPREIRAVIVDPTTGAVANPGFAGTAANGLIWGQYHAPILEYIFPENIPGTPVVPNNFEAIPFLACGGYTSSAGTLAGQLAPWPGDPAQTPVCATTQPPTANAGPAQTVAGGALVTLAGSATGTAPISFAWAQTAGPGVTLSSLTSATPTFTAPLLTATTPLTFQLTATNPFGSSTASVTITVSALGAPTVSYVPANPVFNWPSGSPLPTLTATGVDPNGLPVTVTWTQANTGATGVPTVVVPNPVSCGPVAGTVSCALFTTPITVTLAPGQTAVTIELVAEAVNSLGVSSGPDFTSITIIPLADTITPTGAVWRIGKQRLDITATSSVVSPLVQLKLQPYVTTAGTIYNPDPAAGGLGNVFTNTGGGLYTLTLVGAPEPAVPPAAPLDIKSSLGGDSKFFALTRIRQ